MQKKTKDFLIFSAILALTYCFFAIWYTWPALPQVWSGKSIGVGTDDLTLDYYYWYIGKLTSIAPIHLLSGRIFTPQIGWPTGSFLWIPYLERLVAAVFSFADSQKVTFFFILIMHLLSAMLMASFGRRLGLSKTVSWLMGFSFSFTPYTLYRDQIHIALSGIYFLPLLFHAWLDLSHFSKKRNYSRAALLLFLAATTAHYYLVVMLSLLPLVIFTLVWKEKFRAILKIIACFIPLFLFILFMKTTSQIGAGSLKIPSVEYSSTLPPSESRSWDLLVYSARSLDYLTGHFDPNAIEVNPIKKYLTQHVESQVRREQGQFYPHEHSVGIRWIIILFSILAFFYRTRFSKTERVVLLFSLSLAVIAFALSLSPRTVAPFGIGIGPSQLLQWVLPEIRAPNRWGVGVHAGMIVMAGLGMSLFLKNKSPIKLTLLCFIVFIEFLPTLHFPLHITPSPLTQKNCGPSVVLPYSQNDDIKTYKTIASLKNTDCQILNAQPNPLLSKKFQKILSFSSENQFSKDALPFLLCMGVQSVFFDSLSSATANSLCNQLKGNMLEEFRCELPYLSQNLNWKTCSEQIQPSLKNEAE